jgi:hypothetical protein
MTVNWITDRRLKLERGDDLVRERTGKGVADFTIKQLREALFDLNCRPPRLYRQDKADIVAHIQGYVLTERYGGYILARLREMAEQTSAA